jgi:hypothetical protein
VSKDILSIGTIKGAPKEAPSSFFDYWMVCQYPEIRENYQTSCLVDYDQTEGGKLALIWR